MSRLPGHGLVFEGAPYVGKDCQHCQYMLDDDTKIIRIDQTGGRRITGQDGHGQCQCGFLTGHAMSRAERKELHAEHKDDVRDAMAMDAFARG